MHGEAALGTVRALAGDIGPRGTGTAAEAAARDLVAWLTLGVLAALGLLCLAGAALGGPQWVGWALLLPAGYVAGTVITLVRDDRTPYSPGALDNAGSVAVALEAAARLAGRPLETTEVWVVFTGAEETDHAGLYALLREHCAGLRAADFLGLEGLGGGDLVYLVRQGLCARYEPDPRLAALAATVAGRNPHLGVRAARVTMEDEVGTLRRSGYRALCIAGIDPATKTLAHWHRPDDTPDKVSAVALDRAVAYLAAFLESLDAEPVWD